VCNKGFFITHFLLSYSFFSYGVGVDLCVNRYMCLKGLKWWGGCLTASFAGV